MGPVEILSMLYFAQNALFYPKQVPKKNNTEGANNLEAIPVSPVRAYAAIAPGDRIVREWRALSPVETR
jgi:hypothetical protein